MPRLRAKATVVLKPRLCMVSMTGLMGTNLMAPSNVKKTITRPLKIRPSQMRADAFAAVSRLIDFSYLLGITFDIRGAL